jgi:hypothetical protein
MVRLPVGELVLRRTMATLPVDEVHGSFWRQPIGAPRWAQPPSAKTMVPLT